MEYKDIENSSNYIQYDDETIFLKERRVQGLRYVVFFFPRLRTRRFESFYYNFSEMEKNLDALKGKRFQPQSDLTRTVEEELNLSSPFFSTTAQSSASPSTLSPPWCIPRVHGNHLHRLPP